MRLILPILLALIGVAAGGAVGYYYVSAKKASETETTAADPEATDAGAPDEAALEAVGGRRYALQEAAADSEYLPLSRKLIVPFERRNGRKAYVAVDVTLEMGPGESDFATLHEPKVIDAFLRVLINFAATGAFDDTGQASATLDELNAELLSAAEAVLGSRIRGVLIANILTQDE